MADDGLDCTKSTAAFPTNSFLGQYYIQKKCIRFENTPHRSHTIHIWCLPSRHGPDFHRPQSQILLSGSLMSLMREELQRSHVLITSFDTIIFQTVHAVGQCFLAWWPWPMTLTFELGIDSFIHDLHAQIQVRMYVCLSRIVRRAHTHQHLHTDTQTMSKLLHRPLTRGVNMIMYVSSQAYGVFNQSAVCLETHEKYLNAVNVISYCFNKRDTAHDQIAIWIECLWQNFIRVVSGKMNRKSGIRLDSFAM